MAGRKKHGTHHGTQSLGWERVAKSDAYRLLDVMDVMGVLFSRMRERGLA
jgi:hypothetical protein